jgi:hypothetical protein
MSYPFSPDIARLVQDGMARGGYTSEDDLLRDALRALEEISVFWPSPKANGISNFDELRREVHRGLEPLDRGESRAADEVFAELLGDLPEPNPS